MQADNAGDLFYVSRSGSSISHHPALLGSHIQTWTTQRAHATSMNIALHLPFTCWFHAGWFGMNTVRVAAFIRFIRLQLWGCPWLLRVLVRVALAPFCSVCDPINTCTYRTNEILRAGVPYRTSGWPGGSCSAQPLKRTLAWCGLNLAKPRES